MSHWGADTYEIDRALSLARYQGNAAEVTRLELELGAARARCTHQGNPPERRACVWCGMPLAPGLCKVAAPASEPERMRRGA